MLEDHLIYVHKIQTIYDVVEPSVCKVVAESPNCMAQQKITSSNLANTLIVSISRILDIK
jgi:hypothetical protein